MAEIGILVKNVNIIRPHILEIIIICTLLELLDSSAELMLVWISFLFTYIYIYIIFQKDKKITTFNGCPSIKYESFIFSLQNFIYFFLGDWIYEKYFHHRRSFYFWCDDFLSFKRPIYFHTTRFTSFVFCISIFSLISLQCSMKIPAYFYKYVLYYKMNLYSKYLNQDENSKMHD